MGNKPLIADRDDTVIVHNTCRRLGAQCTDPDRWDGICNIDQKKERKISLT